MSRDPLQPRRSAFLAAACLALAGCAGLVLVATPSGAQPQAPEPPGKQPKKLSAEEYRQRYPFQSVADRLEYESERAKDPGNAGPVPRLTSETAKRLEDAEQSLDGMSRWEMRRKSLALLHSDEAEKFVQRDGFGVSRMPTPSVKTLDLPPAPTVAFATPGQAPDPAAERKVTLPRADKGATGVQQMPSLEMLGAFHLCGEMNFINLPGFGHVKDREHVAGFQAHQFRSLPEWNPVANPPRQAAQEKEHWLVARLELVSLLKHKEPAVYVGTELPRMEELKKAPTRPPSEFEAEALKALREGEDVVTEATTNHIGMVGALRASKQCLECHQVRRGDLLGAFSYDLLRDPPLKAQ